MNSDAPEATQPILVVADFVCTEAGHDSFLRYVEQTLRETRSVGGCLHAEMWIRPNRRYRFSTLWTDREALARWVENEFHRTVLVPGFRTWCSEGWFGEYRLEVDHSRAMRCGACGRWSQGQPGWAEMRPAACRSCGAPLPSPATSQGVSS